MFSSFNYSNAFTTILPFSSFKEKDVVSSNLQKLNWNIETFPHQLGQDVRLFEGVNVEDVNEGVEEYVVEKSLEEYRNADEFNSALTKLTQRNSNNKSNKHSKKTRRKAAQEAQDLLESMETFQLNSNGNSLLNIYSYTTILDAWAKCGEPQKAHDLLQRLVDATATTKKSKSTSITPNTVAFNIVINAWARVSGSSKFPQASKTAQQLLQVMENHCTIATSSNKKCSFAPNTVTYNAVMNCIGRSSKGIAAAQQAESILHRMASNNYADSDIIPNDVSFGTVLSAYAKSAETVGTQAANKAEALLEQMEQMFNNGTALVGPTTFCVNSVINAWSQAAAMSHGRGKYQAALRAEQILTRMEHLYNDKKRQLLRPNTVTYNTVLGAWAKSGAKVAPDKAEALLRKMDKLSKENDVVTPDNISYNTVLHAWARSDSKWAAKRAESILRHMDKLYATGNSNIQPDTVTYSTCINAWARAAASHTFYEQDGISPARNAEAILRRMEHVYQNNLNPRAKPNLLTYNTVLNAWSKSGEKRAAKQAFDILKSMEKDPNIQPDVYSFTSVIDACAKAKDARMAEKVLEKMENLYNSSGNTSVKPNIRSYTSVINAYSHDNDPEQAESILHRMEQMYDSGDHDDLQPDTVCYNAVIKAYGWSTTVPNKAEKARAICFQMKDLYDCGKNQNVKPDIVTCNSVLNACAYTKTDEEQARALDIAISVYEMFIDEAPEYGELNHITYGNMILACTNLVPLPSGQDSTTLNLTREKRRKLAETVWWHCCQKGKVSAFVLSKFKDALSFAPDIFFEIIGKPMPMSKHDETLEPSNPKKRATSITINELPFEWTRFAGNDGTVLRRGQGSSRSKFNRGGKATMKK